jgi:hypothetical protein
MSTASNAHQSKILNQLWLNRIIIFQSITSFLTGSSFSDKINSMWHGDDM